MPHNPPYNYNISQYQFPPPLLLDYLPSTNIGRTKPNRSRVPCRVNCLNRGGDSELIVMLLLCVCASLILALRLLLMDDIFSELSFIISIVDEDVDPGSGATLDEERLFPVIGIDLKKL